MLKVAVVGCGKIADAHVSQIRRVRGCEIVGVCDTEPLMAEQLAERFRIRRKYTELEVLLEDAKPDVVHITTPPESHVALARLCLASGVNVYVEKPFTLNYGEAECLIALADQKKLKLTVGHDAQFNPVARRMRELVRSGYLGGAPVHLESYYCYELGDSSYVRALLSDKQHWVRRLPGKLLHNIISHGIAKVAEFLTTESPKIIAHGFPSAFLKERGESEIIDELRVIISEESGMTAYFTFSSQMRPSIHQLRVFGPRNGFIVDQDQETLIKLRGGRYKSYAENVIPPVMFASQYASNVKNNVGAFLSRDLHVKSGMKYLIESFYRSIAENKPVPIPYREILLTAWIMDKIFEQLYARNSSSTHESHSNRHIAAGRIARAEEGSAIECLQ